MNATQNNNIPYIIIILLLIVIAILAFFVGKSQNGGTTSATPNTEKLTITVIDDKRCTDCNTLATLDQLKAVPALANATFEVKDFSDKGSEKVLESAGINKLPAFIFEHNRVGDLELPKFLVATKDNKYSLNIGSSFNPYAKRSERGFLFLETDVLKNVTTGLHFSGTENSDFLWIEYSDLGCGACKQFHTSGITEKALENNPTLSKAMVGFLSVGGPTSQSAMEAMECMAQQKNSMHTTAWDNFYKTSDYSSDSLLKFVKDQKLDTKKYQDCLKDSSIAQKVEKQKNDAITIFGVTGTPGNIVINKKTGEYISAGWDIEKAISSLK